MTDYKNDKRVVMTLDAGGTNFVFSAVKGCEEIISPITYPSNAHDLDKCLDGIIKGFNEVKTLLNEPPVAISFAFPGPADYPNGIIGDLANLPAFRGGIALGPMLKEIFGLPVFINNDGDLYAYGEAIAGMLPWVNEQLEKNGSPKRFKNILGLTLGTGLGGGIVHDNHLLIGDNSAGSEVWAISNKYEPEQNIEELVSIRAVRREYATILGINPAEAPTPKDIYDIALGKQEGNKEAAKETYRRIGRALGDVLCNLLTVVDGIAVIGGGIAGAKELFFPSMLEVMRGKHNNGNPRLCQKVYNLDDPQEMIDFARGETKTIQVPFTEKNVTYDTLSRIGVGISKIGTSKAIAIGAYAYAVKMLDKG